MCNTSHHRPTDTLDRGTGFLLITFCSIKLRCSFNFRTRRLIYSSYRFVIIAMMLSCESPQSMARSLIWSCVGSRDIVTMRVNMGKLCQLKLSENRVL